MKLNLPKWKESIRIWFNLIQYMEWTLFLSATFPVIHRLFLIKQTLMETASLLYPSANQSRHILRTLGINSCLGYVEGLRCRFVRSYAWLYYYYYYYLDGIIWLEKKNKREYDSNQLAFPLFPPVRSAITWTNTWASASNKTTLLFSQQNFSIESH